jgi:hypothetical protein
MVIQHGDKITKTASAPSPCKLFDCRWMVRVEVLTVSGQLLQDFAYFGSKKDASSFIAKQGE